MKNNNWMPILGAILLALAFKSTPVVPPQPVDPKPPVVVENPPPFVSEGLTVFVVEDGSKRHELPVSQVSIFSSAILDKRLKDIKANARFWNITEDGEFDEKVFQEAAKVKRDSVPWIVIVHGKKWYSGPLPLTVDATVALVDQYK